MNVLITDMQKFQDHDWDKILDAIKKTNEKLYETTIKVLCEKDVYHYGAHSKKVMMPSNVHVYEYSCYTCDIKLNFEIHYKKGSQKTKPKNEALGVEE